MKSQPAAVTAATFSPAKGLEASKARAIDAYVKKLGSRGIVVLQHGQVVHQYLAPGVKTQQPFDTWSMAKTFTSALVGVAIEQRLIKSLDQPVSDFVPELKQGLGAVTDLFHPHDRERGQITIRQLLSGTSGIGWDLVGDYGMSMLAKDKSGAAMGKFMEAAPGTRWRYNNHAVQLLEVVLRRALEKGVAQGRSDLRPTATDPNIVEAFARRFLWEPAGMGPETSWKKDGAGHVTTYSSVMASFDGLSKFGALLMNGGRTRDGRQVIPAAHVREMTRPSQSLNPNYGLLTWVKGPAKSHLTNTNQTEVGPILPGAPDGSFALEGFGQNFVVAVPQEDLLIVHLKPAPVLEKNPKSNVLKEGWDLINDGNRSDEDQLVGLVLSGLSPARG